LTAFKEKEEDVQSKCKNSLSNPFFDEKEILYKNLLMAKQ
jgi:hypothetical protein